MGLFSKKKEGEEERAVAKTQQTAPTVPPVTEETVDEYMQAFGLAGNLQKHEVQAFRHMATMFNLNPFKREIHCNAYGSGEYRTLTIVTGYEVYIQKAEKSGKLEYWHLDESHPDTPLEKYWARLTVKRRDRKHEQSWTSYYTECVQRKRDGKPNSIWSKQPRFMTKKVAMSQGFRLFFEDVMHGIPYTDAEAEIPDYTERDVSPSPQPLTKPVKEEPKKQEEQKAEETEEVPFEPAEKSQAPAEIDYKKEIVQLMNNSPKIPKMDVPTKIAPAFRQCQDGNQDFKTLYENLCSEYGIQ